MDGLTRPAASKGVSKRSHLHTSGQGTHGLGDRNTREPSGQGTREHGGLSTREHGGPGTRGPSVLSTHWPGGVSTREPREPSIHESGGPSIHEPCIRKSSGLSSHEPGGPGTRGPGGLSTRDLEKSFTISGAQHSQPIQKRQIFNWVQNEESRNSFSCQSPEAVMNEGEEYDQEEYDQEYVDEVDSRETKTDASDDEHEENIVSTSHGKTITRKETRALGETRKSRLSKKNLVSEVDECSGRIVGDDSQLFITKGGCVMRKFTKLDGTTWKKQDELLKKDIITKSVENSNYDETCEEMERAMQRQLAIQHKNKQYRLHLHFKKYPTKEAAMMHPPDGVQTGDWVNLCDRFASESFQEISTKNKINRSFNKVPPTVGSLSVPRRVDMKTRKGKHLTAIEKYEMAHYSKKRHIMVNEEAEKVLNALRNEEANSTLTPAKICLKQLKYIPRHNKRRSASTRTILGSEKLRLDLESEKERAKALEDNMKVMKKKQCRLQKQNKKFKGQLKFMMKEINRLSRLQSQANGGT